MIFLELLAGITIVGLVLYKGVQLQRGLGSTSPKPSQKDFADETAQEAETPLTETVAEKAG